MSILLFLLAGIVIGAGVVLSGLAMSAKNGGDYESGYKWLRTAEKVYAVGASIGLFAQWLR